LTSPTRRTFLRTSALAAISASIALSPARLAFGQDTIKQTPSQDFAIPYEAKLDPVFSYRKSTFDPYVGGIFTARGTDGRKVNLTLTAVRAPQAPKTATLTAKARQTESFTLIFSASGPLSELSSIHQLEHAALGKFSLFLVHFEDEKGREFYEAVINHAVQ
jgi:hypothetical protein